jgi:hypothetical protein
MYEPKKACRLSFNAKFNVCRFSTQTIILSTPSPYYNIYYGKINVHIRKVEDYSLEKNIQASVTVFIFLWELLLFLPYRSSYNKKVKELTLTFCSILATFATFLKSF